MKRRATLLSDFDREMVRTREILARLPADARRRLTEWRELLQRDWTSWTGSAGCSGGRRSTVLSQTGYPILYLERPLAASPGCRGFVTLGGPRCPS